MVKEAYREVNLEVPAEMVWIDLETCGLRSEDRVLELALKVTDRFGATRGAFTSAVGYGNVEEMEALLSREVLGPVVHDMHTDNQLVTEALFVSALVSKDQRDGNTYACGYRRNDVETRALQFLTDMCADGGPFSMCGASVQFDRKVLLAQMPRLHNWFHYRQYDVSTLIAFAKMAGVEMPDFKRGLHRALPDIEDEVNVHIWAMNNLARYDAGIQV